MATLWDVADHLANHALTCSEDACDAFARSAFNRWYYDAFHAVREVLTIFDRRWATAKHKDVPGIVESKLVTKIAEIARKSNVGGRDHGSLQRQAATAGKAIKETLERARGLRSVADYQPEIVTERTAHGFSLNGCSNSDACGWRVSINPHTQSLMRIARELGIV